MVILLLSIMENQNYKETENRSGKILAGLIIVIIGSLLLVNNIAFNLPNWLFYWSNILIVLGLVIGAKTNFKNGNQINNANQNNGSCKIFTFAKMHQLEKNQTLALFGSYYFDDVLRT